MTRIRWNSTFMVLQICVSCWSVQFNLITGETDRQTQTDRRTDGQTEERERRRREREREGECKKRQLCIGSICVDVTRTHGASVYITYKVLKTRDASMIVLSWHNNSYRWWICHILVSWTRTTIGQLSPSIYNMFYVRFNYYFHCNIYLYSWPI